MRKSYLLVIMLFVSIMAMAATVTPDEARQRISKHMSPRRAAAADNLRLVATKYYPQWMVASRLMHKRPTCRAC